MKKSQAKKRVSAQDKKRTTAIDKKLDERSTYLKGVDQILNVQRARIHRMLEELHMSDIVVVCKMIDPSEKLGRYLGDIAEHELKLAEDTENTSYILKIRDLRYEVLKLLDAKIK